MDKQRYPVDRRSANEVHKGTTPGHRQARIQWGTDRGGRAVKYELSPSSVKGYLRLYRAETGLPPRTHRKKTGNATQPVEAPKDPGLKEYESMSKEELIDALVMARINEARLKKGCSVKGSGVEKEYLPIESGNTK